MPALTNQEAIASAVLATVGIAIPFVASLAGIVYAIRARRVFRAAPALGGRALAGIGLWLGGLGLAAWIYVAYRIATR